MSGNTESRISRRTLRPAGRTPLVRRLVVLTIGVMLAGGVVAGQQAPFWPTERPPRPLPARDVKFPPYEIRTLANGMQIITVLHHEQPAVTMRLLVKAGGAQDPEGKRGVASLVGTLLDQGTTTKSAEQVADQIDSIGGLMSSGSGDDFTSVSVVVMKDSFELAMDLLADVTRNPAFAQEEIERQKEQLLSTQRVNANDPDYVASVLFDRLVYGFHPYGLPGSGTEETLNSFTREDLQAFHKQYFVPNNMVLAIVGDVTRDEAFRQAERVFGNWARAEIPTPKTTPPPEPTRRLVVVDKPDAVQTEIRMGQLAIPRKHADYLAWDLAVKVLGGEGANRLHRVLRSERGLTYGASAEMGARKQAGDYVAETDTRTETTGEALRLMMDEFTRLQRQRVSDRELADAQAYLAGSFPLTIETPNDIASHVIQNVVYELPVEEITTYRERVLAITPDAVQRVASQYIKPDRLSIVLVGNAKAFLPQLKSVGFADIEVIPIDQLDLMSATLRRDVRRVDSTPVVPAPAAATTGAPGYVRTQANPHAGSLPVLFQSPAAPRTPAQPPTPAAPTAPGAQAGAGRSGASLLRTVVEAKGGLAALEAVRTVDVEARNVLQMEQGTMASTTRTYIIYPDRFRVDADIKGTMTSQVYNGGKAWVKNPAGVHDAPPPLVEEFAANIRRDTIPVLIAAAEGRLTARALGAQKGRDGRSVQVLEISGPDVDRIRLYVDNEGLIAGQAHTRTDPSGRQILIEEVFSDYRAIEGVRVPFETEVMQNGQPIMKRTLTSVAINKPLADELFVRPTP